ncbi:ABC transporter permease [Actinoplanes sp. NPDC051851]|uniref:ABC transporter permease n=1 Tax=Actinoplanes sp. NPDC051851 TaxID=3154753 RepID=UPI0034154BEC
MIFLVRQGLRRGLIELRITLRTFSDWFGYAFSAVLLVGTLLFMGDTTVAGGFSLGAMTLPGTLGLLVAQTGVVLTAQYLLLEREDGTLLRAKALPGGMVSYLVGRIVLVGGVILISIALVLIPGLFLVDGVSVDASGWLTLLWLVPLAFLATMPLGAVLGALLENPRLVAFISLPVMVLAGISGIFYPITSMPGWLQGVAQVFPVYWLGLGLRSAFLPDAFAAAELGGAWRTWQTAGVLLFWAVLGLSLAPGVLRRMARRESGSAMAERRQRALSRVGV